MELDEREAHCVARLIQGGLKTDNILNGCLFCKYPCKYTSNGVTIGNVNMALRNRLEKETGVIIGTYRGRTAFDEFRSPFNYLLVNSNPQARGLVERYMKDVAEGKREPESYDRNFKAQT